MSGLTLETIRIIMKELLDGYALIEENRIQENRIEGNRILETSPATTEDEEGSDYSIEEEETHGSKLKRVEERLHDLEAQINRIAIMQEKRLSDNLL